MASLNEPWVNVWRTLLGTLKQYYKQKKKNHNLLQLLQDFITFKRTNQAGFTHIQKMANEEISKPITGKIQNNLLL